MTRASVFLLLMLLLVPGATVRGQAPPGPRQAKDFMGTWVIEITEAMTATQTVTIWERNGAIAASVGEGKSPAIQATGIVKDGNMMVLTISRDGPRQVLENGVPIWAVYVLTLDGDTMKAALTLEKSRTVKRGLGTRQ